MASITLREPDGKDEPISDKSTKSTWRSLFHFTTKSHYVVLAFAIVFAILSGIVIPAFAYLLGSCFNSFTSYGAAQISKEEFLNHVVQQVVYMTSLGIVNLVLSALFLFFWLLFGEIQVSSAYCRLYSSVLNKEMEWFDMQRFGISALLPRIQSQLHELRSATSQPLGFLCQYSCTILVSIGLAFYSAWDLTLVVIASAPVGAIFLIILSKRLQPYITRQATYLEYSVKHITAALSAIATVQCANGQRFELEQYMESIRRARMEYNGQARLNAVQSGFMRFLTLAMFVQGFWYGSYLVSNKSRQPAQVLTAFWSCLIATQTLEGLLQHVPSLEKGRAAGEVLKSVLEENHKKRRHNRIEIVPNHCEGDIQFQNVSFAYPSSPEISILDKVTMLFAAGETTFIVGRSGSGKSTLSNLILGFYKASGKLTIDGIQIDSLDRNWLRNNITVMQQQSILFNESILRNIALGVRDFEQIGPEDLQKCIDDAALSDTIMAFPDGLHTNVGAGGGLMSGGQRQRISFARARLRDTPVLVFDEATSALDRENASTIMRNIRRWRRNKTTIIITHDLSQILEDDYVYVMDGGRVMREGYKLALEKIDAQEFQPLHGSQRHFSRLLPKTSIQSAPQQWSQGKGIINQCSDRNFSYPKHPKIYEVSQDYAMESMFDQQELALNRGQSDDQESSTQDHKINAKDQRYSLHRIFCTIWPNLGWDNRIRLILGFLATVGHAAATPVFSWAFSKLVGTYATDIPSNSQVPLQWSLVILAIAISDGLLSFCLHYLLGIVAQDWVDKLRERAYDRILNQSQSWFDTEGQNRQRLVTCLDKSGEGMKNLLSRFLSSLLVAAMMIIVAVSWSLILCWKLTLVCLACGPLVYWLTGLFDSVNEQWERKYNSAAQCADESFAETFSNIKAVQALTLENYFHRKNTRLVRQVFAMGIRRAVYTGVFFGISDTTILLVIALLFWYSSQLITYQEVSVQVVLTVLSLLLFILTSIITTITFIPQINIAQEMASQLLNLVNLKDQIPQGYINMSKPFEAEGNIIISNLSFTYPSRPKQVAIQNLSLSIPLGSSTAIVGSSGSGKTTLISLLLGLYTSVPASAICIASIPLSKINISALRTFTVLSPQSPPIFPTSIKANIAYALPATSRLSSMDNITRAAKLAGIHTFISSLPGGYDTLIGEGGIILSGGQTTCLGLARALARQPKILILDEPTASLDESGRMEVVAVVEKLVKEGTTVIVATHDATLQKACQHVVQLRL